MSSFTVEFQREDDAALGRQYRAVAARLRHLADEMLAESDYYWEDPCQLYGRRILDILDLKETA